MTTTAQHKADAPGDPGRSALRVVLVDDHPVVRSGVRAMLESEGDIVVVGEAGTAADAVAETEAVRPDVVVMDVRLADGNGIEATREIRSRMPSVAVVMLTSFADEEARRASVIAGAAGFVLKQIRGGRLAECVRRAAAGEPLPSEESAPSPAPGGRLDGLTARERSVLALITAGRTNREIAEGLGIAEKTVKNAVSRILEKLGVGRRVEAAALGARHAPPPA